MDSGKLHALFTYLVTWTGRADWFVEWDDVNRHVSAYCECCKLEPKPNFEDAVVSWRAAVLLWPPGKAWNATEHDQQG